MLLTPYYTRPTKDGIRDYYVRFADESPLPVVIYEIPYRTQVSISPDMLHVLSRHERIIGMKACNTDMYHFLRTIAGVDDSFAVLSGEDRSEEHTSELQSLMRISYAVFCLKKKIVYTNKSINT